MARNTMTVKKLIPASLISSGRVDQLGLRCDVTYQHLTFEGLFTDLHLSLTLHLFDPYLVFPFTVLIKLYVTLQDDVKLKIMFEKLSQRSAVGIFGDDYI